MLVDTPRLDSWRPPPFSLKIVISPALPLEWAYGNWPEEQCLLQAYRALENCFPPVTSLLDSTEEVSFVQFEEYGLR